jgi:hypothetical protein
MVQKKAGEHTKQIIRNHDKKIRKYENCSYQLNIEKFHSFFTSLGKVIFLGLYSGKK